MDVSKYVQQKLSKSTGKIAESWRELLEMYNQKHWHMLMNKVKQLVNDHEFIGQQDIPEFREKFIIEFEHRTNPVTLVEVIVTLAHKIEDKQRAIKFIDSVANTIKNDVEASILFLIGKADLKLTLRNAQCQCLAITEVRDLLNEANQKLQTIDGVVTYVHAPYYKISSAYLREIGDYAAFYREGLRYLGCIDINKLSKDEKCFQAFCLGLAALLGEGVYNFGELLAHPILDSLKESQNAYLIDLLLAFNCGDIKKFKSLDKEWQQQDDLKSRRLALERKIRLLALMELAFMKSVPNRKLTFDEIAKASEIPINDVEFLVMKALANNLVKGRVDEVEKVFHVSWVQPRVLDKHQVSVIAEQIGKWSAQMKIVSDDVKENAREILPAA